MTKDFPIGTVVQSVCGRDRYRVFLVVAIDNEREVCPIVVADGSLRRLASAKHKNPAHLRFVAQATEEEVETFLEAPNDDKILTICKKYDLFEKNS